MDWNQVVSNFKERLKVKANSLRVIGKEGTSKIDFSQPDLTTVPRPEDIAYKLEWQLRVYFGSRKRLMRFESLIGGKVCGAANTEYG